LSAVTMVEAADFRELDELAIFLRLNRSRV
jgi:hypothetical protein